MLYQRGGNTNVGVLHDRPCSACLVRGHGRHVMHGHVGPVEVHRHLVGGKQVVDDRPDGRRPVDVDGPGTALEPGKE